MSQTADGHTGPATYPGRASPEERQTVHESPGPASCGTLRAADPTAFLPNNTGHLWYGFEFGPDGDLYVSDWDANAVLRLDPDVYLATSDTLLSLDDLRRNPRTRKLRAIKSGRFVVADADLLEPGPSVGEGLVEIARLLHPDAVR